MMGLMNRACVWIDLFLPLQVTSVGLSMRLCSLSALLNLLENLFLFKNLFFSLIALICDWRVCTCVRASASVCACVRVSVHSCSMHSILTICICKEHVST